MNRAQVEEARRKIDAEIAELGIRILSLTSMRNTLAPIMSLPPELLIDIFMKIRVGGRTFTERHRSRTTLFLSSVCSAWKDIILGSSKMWSVIDILHPEAVLAFLERSKQADLVINLREIDEQNYLCVGHIFHHLPRIRSLRLHGNWGEGPVEFPPSSWDTPAPILTALDIQYINLPSNPFSGISSSLRRLEFESCTLPSTLLISSKITNLIVRIPHPRLHVDNLASILNQMPSLSNLRLQEALEPLQVSRSPNSISRISLPNLASLFLEDFDSLLAVTLFLNVLEIPTSTKLEISTTHDSHPSNGNGTIEQVLRAYATRGPFTGAWEISTLRVLQWERITLIET
ncbi:hypothetical protein BDN72DRAFT_850214, partial [Pluteus cervinus]